MIVALLAASALWATPTGAGKPATLMMRAWYAQNQICRGGSTSDPTTTLACRHRDETQRILHALGWCFEGYWVSCR